LLASAGIIRDMLRIHYARHLIAFAFTLIPVLITPQYPAIAAVKQKLEVKYYPVSGRTVLDMRRDMQRRGPTIGMRRVYAKIHMDWTSKYTTRTTKKGCRLDKYTLMMDFIITLPKLPNPGKSTRRAQRLFRSLQSNARTHELRHRTIYMGCARRLERKIRRLRAAHGCMRAGYEIRRLEREAFKKCDDVQHAFDRREARNIKYKPFFRQALAEARRKQNAHRPTTGKFAKKKVKKRKYTKRRISKRKIRKRRYTKRPTKKRRRRKKS